MPLPLPLVVANVAAVIQMRSKANKPSNNAPISAPTAAWIPVAIAGTNIAVVIADVAADAIADVPRASIIVDLVATLHITELDQL